MEKKIGFNSMLEAKIYMWTKRFFNTKVQVPGVTKNTEKENNSKMQELLRPQGQNDSKPSYLYKICNRESWILDMSSLKQKMDLKV